MNNIFDFPLDNIGALRTKDGTWYYVAPNSLEYIRSHDAVTFRGEWNEGAQGPKTLILLSSVDGVRER